jgi:hypothetical protein
MTLTLTICKTMMDTMKAFVECDNTQELSKGMARRTKTTTAC